MGKRRQNTWFLIFLLCGTCFGTLGDIIMDNDGNLVSWPNNGFTFTAAGSSSMSESMAITFPPADGSAGQQLTTDGSNVWSWTDPTGGIAGAHTMLNDAGLHTNTAAGSTTRGGIMFVNSTPLWDELGISSTIGSPLTKVLGTDGTDSGFRTLANFALDIDSLLDHGNFAGLDDPDHNASYFTETEMAATSSPSGASLIGIEDSMSLYIATDVEAALEEVKDLVTVVVYAADSIVTTPGGLTVGSVSDIQTINDGNVYTITETNGAPNPNFTTVITYTGIGTGHEANKIQLHYSYDGSIGHTINLEIENSPYDDSVWDSVDTLVQTSGTLIFLDVDIPGTITDYNNSGTTKIRIIHNNNGTNTHDFVIDYAVILDDPAGMGGITDHGQLSGLADDDHTQYLLEDGTRPMSGPLNMGGNEIISGKITILDATPILVLKDNNSLGAASVGFIEWRDSGGGRAGFLGNNTAGNDDFLWKNEQGGNIGIQTTGAGELQIFANVNLFSNDITNVSNLTATSTVQAEQLTSTDDITAQGHTITIGDGTETDISIVANTDSPSTLRYDATAAKWRFEGAGDIDVEVDNDLFVGNSIEAEGNIIGDKFLGMITNFVIGTKESPMYSFELFADWGMYLDGTPDATPDFVGFSADGSLKFKFDINDFTIVTGTDLIVEDNLEVDGNIIMGAADVDETELEILDGATVTTTELNYLDGTTLGTATASNVLAVDSNLDLDAIHNLSIANDMTAHKYIESSLVGWYNFNAGTAADSSSFGNDGSLEGDASAAEDVLELDGTGDHVDLGEDDIFNFTDTEYFLKQSESGDMNSHQGVADDGTNLFTFDTLTVYKRNRTSPYASVASETLANIITAAGGGLAGTNHIGDGVAFGNFVYIPVERWVSCGNKDTQHIVRLNKSDMTYSAHWDISAQNHEVGGITTDGTFLYVASFCASDGEKIWKYNIADGTYVGSDITLSGTTISDKQGITYNSDEDVFYISSDDTDAIYKVSASGVVGDIVYQNTPGSNFEGIDFTQDQMLLISDEGTAERIFFLGTPRTALSGFTISAWVKPSTVTGEHAVVSRYNFTDGKRQYYLFITSNLVLFNVGKSTGSSSDSASIGGVVINTWQHIVGVCDFDNNTIIVYRNTIAGGIITHTDTTVGFTQRVGIGQIMDAALTKEFEGQIDDVRFYDRPLSVYEIERLYKDSNHNFAHFNSVFVSDGFTGSWTNAEGDVVTVTAGIITSVVTP